MTPDRTDDRTDQKEQTPEELRILQQRNRSMMTKRVEAAKKWQAEHQKNAMLFPLAFD